MHPELAAALKKAKGPAAPERYAKPSEDGEACRGADERRRWGPGDADDAWPMIDEAAYYGLAGDVVRMIEPHTESASVALLLNAHVMFGNAIGRGPHYGVEGTEHHANLFVLQVGDTAKARKGTGADRIRQLFRFVDPDWSAQRIHTGLSSGEGVIWEVRDEIKNSRTTVRR